MPAIASCCKRKKKVRISADEVEQLDEIDCSRSHGAVIERRRVSAKDETAKG